jgi:hypothetical protein
MRGSAQDAYLETQVTRGGGRIRTRGGPPSLDRGPMAQVVVTRDTPLSPQISPDPVSGRPVRP